MSPVSTSKSKGKSTRRAAKEQSMVAMKPSHMHLDGGNGSIGSGYDPLLGTFPILETLALSAASEPQGNGEFRPIDDPDDHSGSSPGTTAESDSVSNNSSCSGESEDHKKPTNVAPRMEVIPFCDNDRRDKIRQKNERKHQRQKERRALELHERCTGFIKSRKLEALSHQLVAMGFPADRASMAIIINEGRMEDSVAWLLHEEEENNQQAASHVVDKSHDKVDIADELIRLEHMEITYKCTKQEVERAVIAFEGDLLKAAESLRLQMQAYTATAAPKQSDESIDSTGLSNKLAATNHQYTVLMRNPSNGAAAVSIQQQRREEKDFHYSKSMARRQLLQESSNGILHLPLNGIQPKPTTERSTPQSVAADKQQSITTGTLPFLFPAVPMPVSESLVRPESQYGLTMGHKIKAGIQAGALNEPHLMQYLRQNVPSIAGTGIPPQAFTGYYSSSFPSMEMMAGAKSALRPNLPGIGTGGTLQQIYPQSCFQHVPSGPSEFSDSSAWSSHSNATGGASSLVTPSSLGLFAGWGSSGSSGSWNSNGALGQKDYTSIDWSLNLTQKPSLESDLLFDSWSPMPMGGNAARSPVNSSGCSVYFPRFQENGGSIFPDPLLSDGPHDWTNPFEGKDLLYVLRKYVTAPTF